MVTMLIEMCKSQGGFPSIKLSDLSDSKPLPNEKSHYSDSCVSLKRLLVYRLENTPVDLLKRS